MKTLTIALLGLMLSNLALAQWRPGPDHRRPRPDHRPQQACFFEHDNFAGRSFCISSRQTVYNLAQTGFNDSISSAMIPRGMRVVVYQDSDFRGPSLVLSGDVYSISVFGRFWNDRISSIHSAR